MKTLNQLAGEGIQYVVVKQDESYYWRKDIINNIKYIIKL